LIAAMNNKMQIILSRNLQKNTKKIKLQATSVGFLNE